MAKVQPRIIYSASIFIQQETQSAAPGLFFFTRIREPRRKSSFQINCSIILLLRPNSCFYPHTLVSCLLQGSGFLPWWAAKLFQLKCHLSVLQLQVMLCNVEPTSEIPSQTKLPAEFISIISAASGRTQGPRQSPCLHCYTHLLYCLTSATSSTHPPPLPNIPPPSCPLTLISYRLN